MDTLRERRRKRGQRWDQIWKQDWKRRRNEAASRRKIQLNKPAMTKDQTNSYRVRPYVNPYVNPYA